jgi:hypothetical protein
MWTVIGSDRCTNHSSTHGGPGKGNRNGLRHGLRARSIKRISNIDELVDDLFLRQSQMAFVLDQSIEQGIEDASVFAGLASLHISNGLRISKALRDKQALAAQQGAKELIEMVNEALDQLALELNLEL